MADPRSTSLTERLRNVAAAEGSAVERVRNRLAFQRILARLALHDGWVLKGGFCLELRLGLQARATTDLDLLRQGEHVGDPLDLQDLLDEALDTDLGDSFTFRVRAPRQVRREDEMPSTWRVVVEVLYVGHPFGTSTLDVVTSETFPATATERLLISSSLMGDEFSMPAVSLARHAAEKYHAYARIYAQDRPSSRVKDLVDLALVVTEGLVEPTELGRHLREVFAERDGTDPPALLPEPPGDWSAPFARLAAETGLETPNAVEAWRLVSATYRNAQEAP